MYLSIKSEFCNQPGLIKAAQNQKLTTKKKKKKERECANIGGGKKKTTLKLAFFKITP